jgi:multiple sugar transport system ATP-binding protein
LPPAAPGAPHPGPVKLGFRPEHAALVEASAGGALSGEIYVVEPLGNETLVTVNLQGTLVNIRQPAEFAMTIGTRCAVRPVTGHLHLFDDKTGEALKTAFATASNRPEVIQTAHVKQGRL